MNEIFTSTFYIQLITSLFGSAGFALLFKMRARYLPFAVIGGGLTYAAYYFGLVFSSSVFAAGLAGSAVSAFYSEICARMKKAPALIFLVPCAIPIVPGGSLYRTMLNLISQNYDAAWFYMLETLKVGIGIAGGIVTVSLCFSLTVAIRNHLRIRRNERHADKITSK